MIINQQDQNIMEVFQRVCEQLSQEMISKINKERLNEGKSVLTTKDQMIETLDVLITLFIATTIKMVILPGEELDNIDFSKKISIVKKGIIG